MKKEITDSNKVPITIGPYSQGRRVEQFVFTSGQLPLDPKTGNIVDGGIEVQVKQTLKNLKAILESYSVSMGDVVKVTVFLKNMNDFTQFNRVYSKYFKQKYPARSCVEVSRLPKNAAIEIEAIAITHSD